MSSLYEFDTDRVAGSGNYTTGIAGEALGDRKIVYLGVNGRWYLADADAVATMPVIGLTMHPIGVGLKGRLLLGGFIGLSTWTWTVGTEIYASAAAAGDLTQTPPAGVGDTIQVVGMATQATQMYFSPSAGGGGGSGCAVLEGATAYVGFDECKEPYANYFLCDGTADDVQIQAALDYLTVGRTWQEKAVLKGDFTVSDRIMIPSYTIIEIQGKVTLVDNVNLDQGIFENSDAVGGNVEIEIFGGCIDGNKANQTLGDLLKFQNVIGAHIHGTNFDGAKYRNIWLIDCNRISITECDIENAGEYDGIWLRDSENCIIENNQIHHNGRAGVFLGKNVTDTRYNIIADNEIYSNGQTNANNGVVFEGGTTYNIVTNNIIYDNPHAGISTLDDFSIFSENIIYNNAQNGIKLNDAWGNIVKGNFIHLNGYNGILIDASGRGVINDNIAYNNSQDAAIYAEIRVDDSVNYVIDGNYIQPTKYGVQEIGTSNNNLITNNQVVGGVAAERIVILGAGTIVRTNLNFVTENSGTATIAAANTSIVVAHGCNYTPSALDTSVVLTNLPTADIGDMYVDTFNAANFTIRCRNAPGVATAIFSWNIQRTP